MDISPWTLDMAYENEYSDLEFSLENISQLVPSSNAEPQFEIRKCMSQDHQVPKCKVPINLPESDSEEGNYTKDIESQPLTLSNYTLTNLETSCFEHHENTMNCFSISNYSYAGAELKDPSSSLCFPSSEIDHQIQYNNVMHETSMDAPDSLDTIRFDEVLGSPECPEVSKISKDNYSTNERNDYRNIFFQPINPLQVLTNTSKKETSYSSFPSLKKDFGKDVKIGVADLIHQPNLKCSIKSSAKNEVSTIHPKNNNVKPLSSSISSIPLTLKRVEIDVRLGSTTNIKEQNRKQSRIRRGRKSTNIIEWIYEMLRKEDPCVQWISQGSLTFRIIRQHRLAELWGRHKNNPRMNFNKFA